MPAAADVGPQPRQARDGDLLQEVMVIGAVRPDHLLQRLPSLVESDTDIIKRPSIAKLAAQFANGICLDERIDDGLVQTSEALLHARSPTSRSDGESRFRMRPKA